MTAIVIAMGFGCSASHHLGTGSLPTRTCKSQDDQRALNATSQDFREAIAGNIGGFWLR
jgi:hypothetical protein